MKVWLRGSGSFVGGFLVAAFVIETLSRAGSHFIHSSLSNDMFEYRVAAAWLMVAGAVLVLGVYRAWTDLTLSLTLTGVLLAAYGPMIWSRAPATILPDLIRSRLWSSFGVTAVVLLGIALASLGQQIVRLTVGSQRRTPR